MHQETGKRTAPQRRDRESILVWGMLLFMLFEILVLTVVLVGAMRRSNLPNPPDGPVSLPVFSGGVIPARPTERGDTVSLSAIDSHYAILVNAGTGEIVAQRNIDAVFSPASMTKVMTLIVACESLTEADLERRLAYTQEIADYVRSGDYAETSTSLPVESNGISCIGDEYRIRDLLYGIGVASAADCTYMIAREVAGSEEAFVARMNQKATALGLTQTHFDNAVGFESEGNVTTAREMAVIMAYAMQSDLIADILRPHETADGKYPIRAYYYDDAGQEKFYSVGLTISLVGRMEKYREFTLTTTELEATKTGWTTESFMVATATGSSTGERYVLVLGDVAGATQETVSQKFRNTMIDIETILNTYAS